MSCYLFRVRQEENEMERVLPFCTGACVTSSRLTNVIDYVLMRETPVECEFASLTRKMYYYI